MLARRGLFQPVRVLEGEGGVASWAGTAHGVLQAINTYEHHEGTVRGVISPNATCSAPSRATSEVWIARLSHSSMLP